MYRLLMLASLFTFTAVCGCAELSVYSPFRQQEWKIEQDFGPNFSERVSALRTLAAGAGSQSAADQEKNSQALAQRFTNETNPHLRAELTRTLGAFPTSTATGVLQQAAQDKDAAVRVAACEAWARRGGPEAAQMLAQTLNSDTNLDVRLAAARALGEVRDASSVSPLALALDDANPALQYRAVEALKRITGKDFGGDLGAWREFARTGNATAREPPTVAERFRSWF